MNDDIDLLNRFNVLVECLCNPQMYGLLYQHTVRDHILFFGLERGLVSIQHTNNGKLIGLTQQGVNYMRKLKNEKLQKIKKP